MARCYIFSMRRIFSIFMILSLPTFAVAQTYSNSPIMVITPDSSNPKPPPEPAAPANPPSPPNPPQPSAPATPISSMPATLWPKDTVPIFMTSCTKFHVELIDPCSCIITKVVTQFRHDEFMRLDSSGELTSNPKMQQIRQECVNAVLEEKQRAQKE